MTSSLSSPPPDRRAEALRQALGTHVIVLIGMMGAGKSSVGKRLARALLLPFVDADEEIELAAGKTIPEIFADHGEAEFRAGERRVIGRLLERGPHILATGGGAFMDPVTRAAVAAHGVSVWLRADPDVLMRRVRRKANRPLLQTPDPDAALRALLETREPVYALADLIIQSRDVPHEAVVADIVTALARRFALTD